MKIKIVKNKYINTALLLMLVSALAHMAVLFLFAIYKMDFYVLNYFNILDLDVLFPYLVYDNFLGNVLSVAVAVLIYFLILKFNKENDGQ